MKNVPQKPEAIVFFPTVAGSGAIQILIVAVADTGIYAYVVAEDDKDA